MATVMTAPGLSWQPPDWRDASAYEFTRGLPRGHWAWEFLRLNPGYAGDWAWFNASWKALEAEYGSPPHRDFHRWKSDPRAYRVLTSDLEDSGDEDAVLIECWMGSKWGFYKFPLDPALDAPTIGEQLAWRPVTCAARELASSVVERMETAPGGSPEKLVLEFDLSLPLREQLDSARNLAVARQARLRQSGKIVLRTVQFCAPGWMACLRALDARAAGASVEEASVALLSVEALRTDSYAALLKQADALLNGGYRAILLLPDR